MLYHSRSFVAFFLGAFLFSFMQYAGAWTSPASAPPNGNVASPVNVGVIDQIKSAGLGINSLAVYGNAILNGASRYLNFGTTAGANGYGIRDNAGSLEFKDSGGTWQTMQTIITNYFVNGNTVTQIVFNDGSVLTTASSSPEIDPQVSTLTANRICRSDSSGNTVVCDVAVCGTAPNGTVVGVTTCTNTCTNALSGIRVSTCVNGTVQTTNCPSSGRCSCFTKDAMVTMADGSRKNIHEVRIGDRVLGGSGASNTVQGIDHTLLTKGKSQYLVSINGEEARMTDNHPVMTTKGWKAVNPDLAEHEAYDYLAGKVSKLSIGDNIILADGSTKRVLSLTLSPKENEPKKLYNLFVDGDHTFFADNMLVHGVVPDMAGRFTLDEEHEGEKR